MYAILLAMWCISFLTVLIYEFGFFPKLGILGAALGTVLS
jgi:Na+-driven multidrug efflux pump